MLKILNDLTPFFQDNYRRIHVREFAKLQQISPPTASKLLESLCTENLLRKEVDKRYFYYSANKSSLEFRSLQRLFWQITLTDAGLIEKITISCINPVIILFGSIAKAEAREDSDLDIAIITHSLKPIDVQSFEKLFARDIQILQFKTFEDVPENLVYVLLNGYVLHGIWNHGLERVHTKKSN